ncbi:hypothetical protein V5O48_008643, partial [Marasmius crinis-equi]
MDILADVLMRDIQSHLAMSKLKESPPGPSTVIDASKPTKSCQRMLDLITVVFQSRGVGDMSVTELRNLYPDVCRWMSFFIRTWALGSPPSTAEGLEFQHRIIYLSAATAGALDDAGFVRPLLNEDLDPKVHKLVEGTSPFVNILVELSIRLASILHPCFELIWSRFFRLYPLLEHEISYSLMTIPARYDVTRIFMDILLQETSKPDSDMDIYVVCCALNLMENAMRWSPEEYLHRFLREGIVRKLTKLLHRIATIPARHIRSEDHKSVSLYVMRDCCQCLVHCMEDGFTWACEALDSGILHAIGYAFMQTGLLGFDEETDQGVRIAEMQVLGSLVTFLVIPSIIRRMHRKVRLFLNDSSLQFQLRLTRLSFVLEIFEGLRKHTFIAKDALDSFNTSLEIDLCCSNGDDPHALGQMIASTNVALSVVLLCTAPQCQKMHWTKNHRTECHSLRPDPGHSFCVSKLDECFIRYNTNLELGDRRKTLTRDQDAHDITGALTVHRFDYGRFLEDSIHDQIDFQELVDDLEFDGYDVIKDELIAEKEKLDIKCEVLVLVRYPGEKEISWLVYRPSLEYI